MSFEFETVAFWSIKGEDTNHNSYQLLPSAPCAHQQNGRKVHAWGRERGTGSQILNSTICGELNPTTRIRNSSTLFRSSRKSGSVPTKYQMSPTTLDGYDDDDDVGLGVGARSWKMMLMIRKGDS